MDLESQPEPLSRLVSCLSIENLDPIEFFPLIHKTVLLKPEPELVSLMYQIVSLVISMNSEWMKLIPLVLLCQEEFMWWDGNKWGCLPMNWIQFMSKEEENPTHFLCSGCNGANHKEDNNPLVEINHPFHPQHSLQLLNVQGWLNPYIPIRLIDDTKCYCCGECIQCVVYHCSACSLSINFSCSKKVPDKYIDRREWHEHTLALFPSKDYLTCNLCALKDSSCPFYICPLCSFVVYQRCLNLPRVIKISRHHHRISFTPFFDQGNWVYGFCRRKIHNDYGGYSCIKDNFSYAFHSKCATLENVWDGQDLEGTPEENEVVEPPFVTISNGIIQHFSHSHHYLRLDENIERDYDENKLCQACITPIYFGNFYSCIQCDFILHETCAKLSCKMYHTIHPHQITLVPGSDGIMEMGEYRCSACSLTCIGGFFYNCDKCDFKVNVQCALISEPLHHKSHDMHPLYLTSIPEEMEKSCSICRGCGFNNTTWERFNCIECEFSLCFKCATIPQEVRYKHDKHKIILFNGEEMTNWCEVCEGKIHGKERFYKCDDYCCVTIHIKCLIGEDLYIKPGSSCFERRWSKDRKPDTSKLIVDVLSNNQHMSRPICSALACKKRCPYNIVFQRQYNGLIFCSCFCLL